MAMSKMTKQAAHIAIRADTRRQRLSLLLLVAFGLHCLAIVTVPVCAEPERCSLPGPGIRWAGVLLPGITV